MADAEAEARGGVGAAEGAPDAVFFIAAFFIAAILAEISALFWAMRASADNWCRLR